MLNLRPDEATVELDASPTGSAELESLFLNQDEQRKQLENKRLEDEIRIRREYVGSAKSLTETWIGFSIVMSICQFIKPFGMQFKEGEFIAIIATSLGSVIGLWAIVGRGLFGGAASKI